jgi:two-component system, response regulator
MVCVVLLRDWGFVPSTQRLDKPAAGQRAKTASDTMNDTSNTKIVLMAEDDSDDRLLAKDAFADGGWEGDLRFVDDGEDLLDYLKHRGKYSPPAAAPRPRLILLDLNMPRKDGREALREIKADAELRRIPVVVFTTSKAGPDIDHLYDLGANSFITKPVQFDALVNVLRVLNQYWFNTVELPDPS